MWRQRSARSRSCGPRTSAVPSCCKWMPPAQDLELSCPRFRKVWSIRSFISAGSWSRPRRITPLWRRMLWPSSGQSWSCAATFWAVSSPSLRTTRPFSGWPGPKTQMLGWHDGSLHSRTSTSWCNIGLKRPTPTPRASPKFCQLLQVCHRSLPTHPLCLPYYTILFGQAQVNAWEGGGSVTHSAHKQRAHGQRVRNLSMRQQDNFLSVTFQTAVCNLSARHEHRTDSPAPGHDWEHLC